MGLSNEERLSKFYYVTAAWRRHLMAVHKLATGGKTYENPHAAKVVQDWLTRFDQLVGRMVVQSNYSGAYWILGSNKHSFHTLMGQHYGLGGLSGETRIYEPVKTTYGSIMWWRENLSFHDLVKKLVEGHYGSDNAFAATYMALWWDHFGCLDAMLYAVNRYKDDLFAPIQKDLVSLIGEMVSRRWELAAVQWSGDEASTENMHVAADVEQMLLCRMNVIQAWLEDAYKVAAKCKGNDPLYKHRFDMEALFTRLAEMPLFEVEHFLEQRESKEWKEACKRNERNHKAEKPKLDGLLGPKVLPEEEVRKTIDTTIDPKTYDMACRMWEHVYHTSSAWMTWAELVKEYPRAAKIGRQAAIDERRQAKVQTKVKRAPRKASK